LPFVPDVADLIEPRVVDRERLARMEIRLRRWHLEDIEGRILSSSRESRGRCSANGNASSPNDRPGGCPMSLIRRNHLPITLLCLTLGIWAPTVITAPADDPDASELICGEQRIRVGYAGDRMRLKVGEQIFDLGQAVSASGARYVALDDPTTSFWGKGDRGILEVRGETYPECIPVETEQPPFRATGNEPFWSIEMDQIRVELIMDLGETRINVALTEPEPVEDGRRYRNLIEDGDLQITILDRLCMDTMSGMPHPKTVEVVLDDLRLRGCGGEPVELLQGQEWVVEDIGGGGIIDRSRVTLNFGADGRLWGRASCNSYLGGFALTGESLSLSPSATTMMACAPSLMNQETKFLDLLARVQRFEVDRTGALVLHANDGSTLLARRE